jgi:serine/threonine-protein kinase
MFERCTLIPLCLAAACGIDTPGPGVTASTGPYFSESMFFNQDVSGEPAAATTDQITGSLRAAGGWGNNDRMTIDFSFSVLSADEATPMRTFTPNEHFLLPDCDMTSVPVPIAGHVEGEYSYKCESDGDCHLIVNDERAGKLYEMWRADIKSSLLFEGGCLAVWDTTKHYDDTLRGDQCTSADAAGLPIAPLLFSADEVAAGEIDHAIRFIVPNDRVRQGFVRPATHGAYTAGMIGAPYYGVHLRLRADYPLETLPGEGARVVARALQKFGMYHADGGEYALTAQSDRYTTAKWSGLLGAQDLIGLSVEDFDVIDHGEGFQLSNDCMRQVQPTISR